jgi:hypothetical protein
MFGLNITYYNYKKYLYKKTMYIGPNGVRLGLFRWSNIEDKTPPTRVWSKVGSVYIQKSTPPTRVWHEVGFGGVMSRQIGPPTRVCSKGGSMSIK